MRPSASSPSPGAGEKAFASGSDLKEVEHRNLAIALTPLVQGVAERLERTPKATIAAINGYCMGGGPGGGARLLICGSRRLSRNSPHRRGESASSRAAAPHSACPRLIGRAWAMEMLLMGETIDAKRAFEIGLITRLVEAEELMPTVRKMAEKLAAYAPFVPQFMKAMVHYGMEGSMTAGSGAREIRPGSASAKPRTRRRACAPSWRRENPNGRADELSLEVAGVLETCIYAEDLDAAEAFYRSVSGARRPFQKSTRPPRFLSLRAACGLPRLQPGGDPPGPI